mgnify:CR=1 FL=1
MSPYRLLSVVYFDSRPVNAALMASAVRGASSAQLGFLLAPSRSDGLEDIRRIGHEQAFAVIASSGREDVTVEFERLLTGAWKMSPNQVLTLTGDESADEVDALMRQKICAHTGTPLEVDIPLPL